MSSKVKRGELLLNKIGDRLGMTEAGKAWVTLALDPFHDNPVNCCGYPDGTNSKNITQTIKQSITVTGPTGLAPGVTWDCHIVQWPWVNSTQMNSSVNEQVASFTPVNGVPNAPANAPQSGAVVEYPLTVGVPVLGGLTAYSVPSGSATSVTGMNQNSGLGTQVAFQSMQLPQAYRVGKRRVISAGFEVYNTSAQLYKGGTVCVYRQPIESVDSANTLGVYVVNSAGTLLDKMYPKTICVPTPPPFPANALLLPYSRQWDAEQGCYVVGQFNTTMLAPHNLQDAMAFVYDPYPVNSVTYPHPLAVCNQPDNWGGGAVYPASNNFTPPMVEWSNMDVSGAYFTGLAQGSSLTINWNIILERFPTNDDLDLVVLAKPAPELDDVALKFYSHASDSLPVGVIVKENGFGDWFKDVVSTASDFIAPVLSAIPHPAAQGIGMAIKGINAVANPDRVPRALPPPVNARPYVEQEERAFSTPRQIAAKTATKAKNAMVREKNALIRAKNEEIRARKALKAAKKR